MPRSSARSASSTRLAKEFGRRVRACRLAVVPFLSQENLAERAGIHPTYVGPIERGKASPTLDVIVRLAAALGVDPCELVGGLRPSRRR